MEAANRATNRELDDARTGVRRASWRRFDDPSLRANNARCLSIDLLTRAGLVLGGCVCAPEELAEELTHRRVDEEIRSNEAGQGHLLEVIAGGSVWSFEEGLAGVRAWGLGDGRRTSGSGGPLSGCFDLLDGVDQLGDDGASGSGGPLAGSDPLLWASVSTTIRANAAPLNPTLLMTRGETIAFMGFSRRSPRPW
jgi:hypothetical protein